MPGIASPSVPADEVAGRFGRPEGGWRLRLYRVIFESDTPVGRAFDVALAASRRKIAVFLSFVMMAVLVMGTLMYVIEGAANGFTSIPIGIYWAITTMTTVGFGDITPKTDLGRAVASMMLLLGWGILGVPTGIVSAEFTAQRFRREEALRRCTRCGCEGHQDTARFCRDCGEPLPREHGG